MPNSIMRPFKRTCKVDYDNIIENFDYIFYSPFSNKKFTTKLYIKKPFIIFKRHLFKQSLRSHISPHETWVHYKCINGFAHRIEATKKSIYKNMSSST